MATANIVHTLCTIQESCEIILQQEQSLLPFKDLDIVKTQFYEHGIFQIPRLYKLLFTPG